MDKYLKRTSKDNTDEPATQNADEDKLEDTQKKTRAKSIVWKYFNKTKDKQFAICNKCGKHCKTGGNTSNLFDHLKRSHPEYVDEKENNLPASSCMTKFLDRGKAYDSDSSRKAEIENHLLRMIVLDLQPFNIVNDRGFVGLMQALDPRFKLPSTTYLRDVLIKNEYERLKIKLLATLEGVDHVAITSDGWTSKANEGYLTVTCHYVNDNFELKSAVLSTEKLVSPTNHTAESISNSLRVVLDEWRIMQKVVSVVTDNDATMKKACELLQVKHLPCFAHTINLLVQDVLKLSTLTQILTKCKKIVTFFKSSTIAYEKFKKAQGCEKPHSLIQEVPTRWNSALKMMERILLTNKFIGPVLLNSPRAPEPLTLEEIAVLNEITKILSPFEDATILCSSDKKVTISLILPIVCELNHKLSNIAEDLKTPEAINIIDFLRERLSERLSTYENRTIPRIATLLDPRYKKAGFFSLTNADQAAKALELEAYCVLWKTPKELPTPQEEPVKQTGFSFMRAKIKQKTSSNRADAIIELRQHLENHHESDDCNPLIYWQNMKGKVALPTISKKFFCIPATSCESERMFSKAGLVISDRRCCLKPKVVNEILFLNKNLENLKDC